MSQTQLDRRSWLRGLAGAGGLLALDAAFTAERTSAAAVGPNDNIKISRIETFVLKNSWVFVKISTDAGIVGWGEMLKDDAKACAAGAQEAGRFLVGQDPNRVVYLWQQIQRGGFYRGGPVKTAIQSGIDQALWDIKGKVYGVPVYKLLGGPTRDRIRVYGTVSDKTGVNAMKIQPRGLNRGALNSHPSLRTTRKGPVPWPPATRLPRRFRTSSSRSGAITTTKTFWQNRCRRSKKDSARC